MTDPVTQDFDELPDLPEAPTGHWSHAVLSAFDEVKKCYLHGVRLLQEETTDPLRLKIAVDYIHSKGELMDQLVLNVNDDPWMENFRDVIYSLEERLRCSALALAGW